MSLVGLQELLEAMGVRPREYRAAELTVHPVLVIPERAPRGLDDVFKAHPGAIAWIAWRVGGHQTGAMVTESYLPDGGSVTSVAEVDPATEYLHEWCPALRTYPLGRLGQRATAVLLVDVGRRRVYVVDRDHFEVELRGRLREALATWAR